MISFRVFSVLKYHGLVTCFGGGWRNNEKCLTCWTRIVFCEVGLGSVSAIYEICARTSSR